MDDDLQNLFRQIFVMNPHKRISFEKLYSLKIFDKVKKKKEENFRLSINLFFSIIVNRLRGKRKNPNYLSDTSNDGRSQKLGE